MSYIENLTNSYNNEVKALYIHIPFCNHICAYCDFCRMLYQNDIVKEYLNTLEKELAVYLNYNFETIYIGGGTPSALNIEELKILFRILKPIIKDVKEFSIEVNPESLTYEKVKIFKEAGINRVSIGVQAVQENILKYIFRKHNFQDVKKVIKILNDNQIDNISVDLMYGIPNQSLNDVIESIVEVDKLNVTHISLYCLTIEENSYFGEIGIKQISDEEDAYIYQKAVSLLLKLGYQQYEISNFSKNNKYSKHNLVYWQYQDFIGIGASGASKVNDQRISNTSDILKYINDYKSNQIIIDLNENDLRFEYIMMNLRLKEGFLLEDFNDKFKKYFLNLYQPIVMDLTNKGLLEVSDRLKCSEKGFLLLNEVLISFMEE